MPDALEQIIEALQQRDRLRQRHRHAPSVSADGDSSVAARPTSVAHDVWLLSTVSGAERYTRSRRDVQLGARWPSP